MHTYSSIVLAADSVRSGLVPTVLRVFRMLRFVSSAFYTIHTTALQ